MKKNKWMYIAIILGIAIGITATQIIKAKTDTTTTADRYGEVTKDLGDKPISFGSMAQATELLNIINSTTGKAQYKIQYTTIDDAVNIRADFKTKQLIRLHKYNKGHSTIEGWTGDIIYRLQSAAAGGSLNDTSTGKDPGTFRTFLHEKVAITPTSTPATM